jgi:branched-chain amino acid transport system permease protein
VNSGLFSLLFLLVVLFEPGGIHALLLKLERALRARTRRRRAQMAKPTKEIVT